MSDFKRVSFQLNCLVHSSFILMLNNYSVAPGSGKFDPDTQFLPGFCLPSAKDTEFFSFLGNISLLVYVTCYRLHCQNMLQLLSKWTEEFHPIFQIFYMKKWWSYIWDANTVQISRHRHRLYPLMSREEQEIVGQYTKKSLHEGWRRV